jgi:hypothetical protein
MSLSQRRAKRHRVETLRYTDGQQRDDRSRVGREVYVLLASYSARTTRALAAPHPGRPPGWADTSIKPDSDGGWHPVDLPEGYHPVPHGPGGDCIAESEVAGTSDAGIARCSRSAAALP